MSQFFKVLEQAERERALAEEARRRQANGAPTPAAAPVPTPVPTPAPASAAAPTSAMTAGPVLTRETAVSSPLRAVLGPVPVTSETPERDGLDRVEGHLVSLLYPRSFLAEPYREARHFLEQLHRSAGLSIIAISSPGSGDGKTTTSINLAGALAQAPDARVLLIDADLRQSSVARHLPVSRHRRGLVDLIVNRSLGLEALVQSLPAFNLSVLRAGTLPSAPYEVLKSARLGEVFDEARQRYDYVVVDTAPLVAVPDSRLIMKCVDGLLMVVAAHKTPRKLLADALNVLEPEKIVGMLFNEGETPASTSYGYPAYGASERPKWWQELLNSRAPARTKRRGRK
jgi:capsular exopolysaccharide synthesis family protein